MFIRITLAALVVALFTTCATEDILAPVDPGEQSTAFFNPKESTLIFDEDTNQDILSFDPEEGMVVYQIGSPQLDSIEVGSIILSRPNAEAAGGFLRKVMSVDVSGDRMVLETEPANLPDAFESYRWILGGDNSRGGRDGAEDPYFTYGEEDIEYDTLFDIPGQMDWKFRLNVTLKYTLKFQTEMEYNLSLTGVSMERAVLGLDQFSIDTLQFTMSFVREQGSDLIVDSMSQFTLEDMGPIFSNLKTIGLARFPIDPPSSLVWVEPVIRFDIAEQVKYSIEMGNRFTFTHGEEFFRGLYTKSCASCPFESEFTAPNHMTVDGRVFFEGSYDYTGGLSIGVGIAPYTRGLFTIGARATAGPYVSISGQAALGITAGTAPGGELVIPASAQMEVGVEASAGLFMDASFFGLAPDDWDQEATLWDERYAILETGVDNGCGFFFRHTDADFDYSGLIPRVNLTVTSLEQDGIDISGNYDVYLNNLLVAEDLEPNAAAIPIDLPLDISMGVNSLRLVREGGLSPLFCERMVDFLVPDLTTSTLCNGVDLLTDVGSGATYCIGEYGPNNRRWFTDNLLALIPVGNDSIFPTCPEGDRDLCGPYGGLYNYNELLDISPELTPVEVKGLCPSGFHVPTVEEWLELFGTDTESVQLAGDAYVVTGVAQDFMVPLSFATGSDAESPNFFDVLAAGWYTESSNSGHTGFGDEAYFWTSTTFGDGEVGQEGAYAVLFSEFSSEVLIAPQPRTQRLSCRCVAD